jgi:hypothetical protein
MTALVGREVKRTFSAASANFTGLPRLNTHEPGGQDFGEFGKALVYGKILCADAVRHRFHLLVMTPDEQRV